MVRGLALKNCKNGNDMNQAGERNKKNSDDDHEGNARQTDRDVLSAGRPLIAHGRMIPCRDRLSNLKMAPPEGVEPSLDP